MVLPYTLSWFTILAFDYLSWDCATVLGTKGGGLKGKLPLAELLPIFYEAKGLKLELLTFELE